MFHRNVVALTLMAVAFVAANLVVFTVDETEFAVVTQFGEPIRAITAPGLQWKLPEPIQTVQFFNKRLFVYNSDKTEFLTSDKKNVVVESYVVWRIADPILYLKSLQDQSRAEARLADVLYSELGTALGRQELTTLVNTNVSAMKLPDVLAATTQNVGVQLQKYGIQVVDARLRSLNFPEANKQAVFSRMKAEREQQARRYRSEGAEEAAKIRAEADRQRDVLLSEAYAAAEKLKGDGDAQAIKIYADAYGADPEFYQFLRTLEAYTKFIDEKTTIVLPPDSPLLRYIGSQAMPSVSK